MDITMKASQQEKVTNAKTPITKIQTIICKCKWRQRFDLWAMLTVVWRKRVERGAKENLQSHEARGWQPHVLRSCFVAEGTGALQKR